MYVSWQTTHPYTILTMYSISSPPPPKKKMTEIKKKLHRCGVGVRECNRNLFPWSGADAWRLDFIYRDIFTGFIICLKGTPTKRQVSKRPVSKRLKRQVYKTSGLQNVRFTKSQVFKTYGCKKNNHKYSVLVVGGNPQVMLQPCLLAKWWLCFIFYFWGFFVVYHYTG